MRMADPVGDIIGDYRAFAALQRDRLAARGIDIAPYALSHLAFRVADWDVDVHLRTFLERHATANFEDVWNGRPTAGGAPQVYNPDLIELRGDHEAVRTASALWIRVDAPSDVKLAARRARQVAAQTYTPPTVVDPRATKIAERRAIPLERTVVATDAFWLGNDFTPKGSRHDVEDKIVQAAPTMFRRLDGSPIGPKLAA